MGRSARSAGDVEDRVHLRWLERREQAACVAGGERKDGNPASRRLRVHLRGDGQAALGARADDEPRAIPGDVLGEREGRVPVPVAETLRGPLVSTPDVSGGDHHVVSVPFALELDLPERDQLRLHEPSLPRASTPRTSQGAPGGRGHGWPTDALACAR